VLCFLLAYSSLIAVYLRNALKLQYEHPSATWFFLSRLAVSWAGHQGSLPAGGQSFISPLHPNFVSVQAGVIITLPIMTWYGMNLADAMRERIIMRALLLFSQGLGLFQKCQRTSQWNCSWGRQSETSETCKIDLHSGEETSQKTGWITKAYLLQTFLAITWSNKHSFNFYSFAVDWLDITWLWLSERMVAT
jgi:hypothetical protein